MKRVIRVEGDVAFVPLTQGYEAIIDAADAEAVKAWDWYAKMNGGTTYAVRTCREGQRQRTVMLHRFLLGGQSGPHVDHRDGDGLNNRRNNLRSATCQQNQHNAKRRADNKSGVKGVTWDCKAKKWRAGIRKNGLRLHLGFFESIVDAATAYAAASTKIHGEFGRTG